MSPWHDCRPTNSSTGLLGFDWASATIKCFCFRMKKAKNSFTEGRFGKPLYDEQM
jgi:hypothetical protein